MASESWLQSLHHWLLHRLDDFRQHISRPEAILSLCILGLISGVFAAITVIALRLLVDYAQLRIFAFDHAEAFESISPTLRFLAPVLGGLLIGLLFYFTSASSHRVGVTHILERLAYHQGRLPWRNAVIQFFGGAISMISGHSVGREGPSAHLGAASSNLPAQALGLPNNSLRVLAACGAAAGIAASFNTPLAGAAFALEVLVMEYTVAGFAPVIMATVSATALTQAVFGQNLAYNVPPLPLGALSELPYILLIGILIGVLAALFNHLFQTVTAQGQRLPAWLRPMLAGVLVGLCGMVLPEVMGMGDDTVNEILLGKPGISLLLAILVIKIIATTGGIGLGLPGGIIGPTLFIGAAAGGLFGTLGASLGINEPDAIGLYAMIGMGAMMAGSMQAPLAGLIAILELTGNLNFIMPGMLAVVAATITAGRIGRRESLFQGLLRSQGLDYRNDPISQSLRRIGVAGVMNRKIGVLQHQVTSAEIDTLLTKKPQWILVREPHQPEVLLTAVALVRARKEFPDLPDYDLSTLPGERLQTKAINMRASLQEAREIMQQSGAEALYVINQTVPGIDRVYGVLTEEDIEQAYQY